jgi:hypothetical protein
MIRWTMILVDRPRVRGHMVIDGVVVLRVGGCEGEALVIVVSPTAHSFTHKKKNSVEKNQSVFKFLMAWQCRLAMKAVGYGGVVSQESSRICIALQVTHLSC